MAAKSIARNLEGPKPEELDPEVFPELTNLSAAFFYKFIPRPLSTKNPEFVHIPLNLRRDESSIKRELTVSDWNMCWEAGHIRPSFIPQVAEKHFDPRLAWLQRYKDVNLYLLPTYKSHRKTTFRHVGPMRKRISNGSYTTSAPK